MVEATNDFVAWAQNNVRTSGINQLANWSATAMQEPPRTMCTPPISINSSEPVSACSIYERIRWNVTGDTAASTEAAAPSPSASKASDLATAQNEQRLSATITVEVTDASGTIVLANHSREVTARLFHAFPYVAITGARDVTSEVGDVKSSEGDTAGVAAATLNSSESVAPVTAKPAEYTNTDIVTTIDCYNTTNNSSSNPELDGNNVSFFPVRAYGNVAWSYEVPCAPSIAAAQNGVPNDSAPPRGHTYANGSYRNAYWQKGDDNGSSFAR